MGSAIAKLAAKDRLRVAGLMSGTSADGVDAAVVDVSRKGARLLAFGTFPYPARLREELFRLFEAETGGVGDLCRMNFALGEVFATALLRLCSKAGIRLESIDLVGSHGQTILHDPPGRRRGRRGPGCTMQIAEPCVIAERTGITTVADFRPRDLAAGGQGAPLVPYADYVLFAHKRLSRAVQNIGGIANVTYLPAGGDLDDILAFDTGPGNMVIDRLVRLVSGGRAGYDSGGRMAAGGKVDEAMLAELMKHRFLRRRPPKSTGREEFGWPFADALYGRARRRKMAPNDVLATVTAFTAASIAEAYRRFLKGPVDEVILCGGGARNRTLVGMLRQRLQSRLPAAGGREVKIKTSDDFGISVDAKEAVSFAILAAETIGGRANNVPAATGARRPVVLGKIIPGR